MASPIKILVCSPYYPPHVGGLENHAEEFAIHAKKRGHEVTIWTANIPRFGHLEEIRNGIRIFRFEAIELLGGFPVPAIWKKEFWEQYKKIKQSKYDIILSRTRFFLTSIVALLYAKMHHSRYIHIEHGSDFVQLDSPIYSVLAKIYDYTMGKLVFFTADTVITNSHASARFVKEITHNAIIPHVIYRGLEPVKISPENFPHSSVRPIMLYTGRLIDGKGVQDLIYALKNVEHEQWVAWIVGNGPHKNYLQELVHKLNLSGRVKFWGEKSHEKALEYISAADVLINPSYTEGIPSTVIEAAKAGKAIIATNVGGTPEVIIDGQTGMLYPPRDIAMLTQHIATLLKSPARRKYFGNKAKESMIGRFSWEEAMIQYEYVWNIR